MPLSTLLHDRMFFVYEDTVVKQRFALLTAHRVGLVKGINGVTVTRESLSLLCLHNSSRCLLSAAAITSRPSSAEPQTTTPHNSTPHLTLQHLSINCAPTTQFQFSFNYDFTRSCSHGPRIVHICACDNLHHIARPWKLDPIQEP